MIDLIAYILFKAHKTQEDSVEDAAILTARMIAGMFAVTFAFVPNGLLLLVIPGIRTYLAESQSIVAAILAIAILPIITFSLAYKYAHKKYNEDYLASLNEKYGNKIAHPIAIILTIPLVLICSGIALVALACSIAVLP